MGLEAAGNADLAVKVAYLPRNWPNPGGLRPKVAIRQSVDHLYPGGLRSALDNSPIATPNAPVAPSTLRAVSGRAKWKWRAPTWLGSYLDHDLTSPTSRSRPQEVGEWLRDPTRQAHRPQEIYETSETASNWQRPRSRNFKNSYEIDLKMEA
jgi:hypothetical protein